MLTKNENVIYLGFAVQFDFKESFFLQISINMQIWNCIMILQTILLWHIPIYIMCTIKMLCLSHLLLHLNYYCSLCNLTAKSAY